MFKTCLIVAAFIAVASARIRSCDRGTLGPNPEAVRIVGCTSTEVCRLIRGSDVVGQFDFIASKFSVH